MFLHTRAGKGFQTRESGRTLSSIPRMAKDGSHDIRSTEAYEYLQISLIGCGYWRELRCQASSAKPAVPRGLIVGSQVAKGKTVGRLVCLCAGHRVVIGCSVFFAPLLQERSMREGLITRLSDGVAVLG